MLEFIFGSVVFLLLLGAFLGFAAFFIFRLAYGLLVCAMAAFLLLRSVVSGKPLPSKDADGLCPARPWGASGGTAPRSEFPGK